MAWVGGRILIWLMLVAAARSPEGRTPSLPATALPLQLAGIMLDRAEPGRSACLIRCSYPVEKEARYLVGQTVCDVATVSEVRQDGVVIRNPVTRRDEWLTYPADTRPPAQASTDARPVPAPVVSEKAGVVSVELPAAAVEYYTDNLPELLASALASPRYKDTASGRVIDGFQIGDVRDKGIVQQLGLRNGDVLAAVNGQPLDGLPTILKLLGELQGQAQVKVTVLRGTQTLTFVFKKR